MRDYRPVDWVALMITGALCLMLTVAAIRSVLGYEATDYKAGLIAELLDSLVVMLSVYIGHSFKGKRDENIPNRSG